MTELDSQLLRESFRLSDSAPNASQTQAAVRDNSQPSLQLVAIDFRQNPFGAPGSEVQHVNISTAGFQ